MIDTKELLSIKEANEWATNYLHKTVTTSNISYFIQWRIKKLVIMARHRCQSRGCLNIIILITNIGKFHGKINEVTI